jgi:TonB family protein
VRGVGYEFDNQAQFFPKPQDPPINVNAATPPSVEFRLAPSSSFKVSGHILGENPPPRGYENQPRIRLASGGQTCGTSNEDYMIPEVRIHGGITPDGAFELRDVPSDAYRVCFKVWVGGISRDLDFGEIVINRDTTGLNLTRDKTTGAKLLATSGLTPFPPPPPLPPPAPGAPAPVQADRLVPVSKAVVHGPVSLIYGQPLVYPPAARAARVRGTVKLEVLVDSDGHALAFRVLTGHAMMNDAVIDSVRRYVFEPRFGAVITTVELTFALISCDLVGGCP